METLDLQCAYKGNQSISFSFYSNFFSAHGLPYQPEIEAFTSDQILPMVEAGLEIGFVPEDFLDSSDQVLHLTLAEPLPTRSLGLMKQSDQPLSLAAKELERIILRTAKEQRS